MATNTDEINSNPITISSQSDISSQPIVGVIGLPRSCGAEFCLKINISKCFCPYRADFILGCSTQDVAIGLLAFGLSGRLRPFGVDLLGFLFFGAGLLGGQYAREEIVCREILMLLGCCSASSMRAGCRSASSMRAGCRSASSMRVGCRSASSMRVGLAPLWSPT